MYIILIDSGTTNSRIRLNKFDEERILDSIKLNIGVRNTAIDGNNSKLRHGLIKGIKELLERNHLDTRDIMYIVASGMITSNMGIYEVPHITSPASVDDFVAESVLYTDEDFFNIPVLFIPGMRNKVTEIDKVADRINQFDIMRGEEVETLGLLEQINVSGSGIMVLPGSHTKYIYVNNKGEMLNCLSTLSGELMLSTQKETILTKSLPEDLVTSVDEDMIKKGYLAAEKYGVTRALYHIRLLDFFSDLDKNQIANYYAGVILHDDLKALFTNIETSMEVNWVIVGGSDPLKSILDYLLNEFRPDWKIIKANEEQVEYSTVIGSKYIVKKYRNNN